MLGLLNIFKKLNFYIIIFVLSLITGIIAIESNSDYFLNPDSTGYHNMAINILETGKHTDFFREPGYPYFLAGCYNTYKVFGGNPTRLRAEDYNSKEKRMSRYKPEIYFAKYMQLLLLILSIMMFYSTVKHFFSEKISKFTAILCSTYYPFIISSIYLLREPFLVFLISLSSYFLMQYFISKKIRYMLFATIIIGIGALTFQVVIAFYAVIPIAILKNNKGLKARLLVILSSLLMLFITIFPWSYNVYKYYPDIRIVKTVGCSLTIQGVSYVLALRNAHEKGILSDQELTDLEHKNWYTLSDYELFERSFNGWYTSQADSLNQLINIPLAEKSKIKALQLTKYFSNIFVHKNYSPFSNNYDLTNKEKVVRYILVIVSLIIAIFSFLGLVIFPKKKLIYFMPQMMFILLFFILGSENRRFLPALPFLLFLFIYFIVEYVVPRLKNQSKNIS